MKERLLNHILIFMFHQSRLCPYSLTESLHDVSHRSVPLIVQVSIFGLCRGSRVACVLELLFHRNKNEGGRIKSLCNPGSCLVMELGHDELDMAFGLET